MLCCVLSGVVLVCCMYVLLVDLLLVVGTLCVVGVCWCWYVDCIGCWLLVVGCCCC